MDTISLKGTDKRLYELVAPLVMNPAILRQNNNYPFKTSARHEWALAIENGEVVGFMPVKLKNEGGDIDNYYISGDRSDIIDALLGQVLANGRLSVDLTALVHKRHVADFARNGFSTVKEWKNYDKMQYDSTDGDEETA